MRRLIALTVILASLWGGYWYIAASGLRTALPEQVEHLRRAGWQIDYDSVKVVGFPSRLDTRVEALSVATPDRDFAVDLSQIEVLALSYKPNHVIAVAPETFDLVTPLGPVQVQNQDLRASLRLRASTDLPLEQAIIVGEVLALSNTTLGQAQIAKSQLALRPVPARAGLYEAVLELNTITPPAGFRHQLDTPVIDRASVSIELRLDAPLDRHAVTSGAMKLSELTLTQAQLSIGESSVNLSGALRPSRDGTLAGQIRVNARGWRDLLDMINAPGFDPVLAEQMLGGVAQEDGTIQLDLTLRDGFAYLGLIPLFPAPRLF